MDSVARAYARVVIEAGEFNARTLHDFYASNKRLHILKRARRGDCERRLNRSEVKHLKVCEFMHAHAVHSFSS